MKRQMNRLGIQTEPSQFKIQEEDEEDANINVDPYRALGFGFIAMK